MESNASRDPGHRTRPAEPGPLFLSVVIPVYRNAPTIRPLHDRLRTALDPLGFSYEMIFVNDAGPDDSISVLCELAVRDPRLLAVSLARNVGQHAAVLVGLSRCRGRWIVIMDGDLQDPPEAIPSLLDRASEGADAVFAARRGKYESPIRLATSRAFKGLMGLFTGLPSDVGMFVLLERGLAERLLALRTVHPFVVAMIGCCGAKVATVPVQRSRRSHGKSAYTSMTRLKAGFTGILCAIECRWRPRRRTVLERLGPKIVVELVSAGVSADSPALQEAQSRRSPLPSRN